MERILWPEKGNNEMFSGLSHDEKINYLENKLGYDRDMIIDLTDDDLIDVFDNDYRNDDKAALIKYVDKMNNQCVSDTYYLEISPPIKTTDLINMLVVDNGALKLNDKDEVVVDCAAGDNIRVFGIQDLDALSQVEDALSTAEEMEIAFKVGSPVVIHESIEESKLREAVEDKPADLSSELEEIHRLYDDYGLEYFTAMPLYNLDNDNTSIEYQYPNFFNVVIIILKEIGKFDADDSSIAESAWYRLDGTDFNTILKVCDSLISADESPNNEEAVQEIAGEELKDNEDNLEESFDGNQSLKSLLKSKSDKEEISEECFLDKEELEENDDKLIEEQLNADLDKAKLEHINFYRYNAGLAEDAEISDNLDNFAIERVCSKYNISKDSLKEELLGEIK